MEYKKELARDCGEADESLMFSGYFVVGREIVPVRTGNEIPTVVGYWLDNKIVVRKSVYDSEQLQIGVFREVVREKGLPFVVE